jgi:DNA-binding NtrC family response regulator
MSEKVLLVDDEKEFRDAMSVRMKTREMDVSTASSAEEAIEKVEKNFFDAIILDFQMPGMDGFKALKIIKSKQPQSHIILLTGYATVEKEREAIQAGASDLIEKPPDLEELLHKIRQAKTKIDTQKKDGDK